MRRESNFRAGLSSGDYLSAIPCGENGCLKKECRDSIPGQYLTGKQDAARQEL